MELVICSFASLMLFAEGLDLWLTETIKKKNSHHTTDLQTDNRRCYFGAIFLVLQFGIHHIRTRFKIHVVGRNEIYRSCQV